MTFRLRHESPDRDQGPGQHAGLPARQTRHRFTPACKPVLVGPAAVQELVEACCETLGAARRFHGVPQRHFLERKQEIRARLNPHRVSCNFLELSLREQRLEFARLERVVPLLVRAPLITPLPIDVRFIVKTAGKIMQKLFPGPCRAGTLRNGRMALGPLHSLYTRQTGPLAANSDRRVCSKSPYSVLIG